MALYYLWRTGEVMTHHRENFERVYALTENVAPEEFIRESDPDEADLFLIQKEISFSGLSRLDRKADGFQRGVPFSKKEALRESLLANDKIVEVKVKGWRSTQYMLTHDVPLLDAVAAGGVPEAWRPLDTDTTQEVVFLAPLDKVSARGRAKVVFDFNYVWEVYKPAEKRQYGYYTMPILWGDQLVARFDSKFDRTSETFVILGLWLEDDALGQDDDFAGALARGFARFVRFLGASQLDAQAINEPLLRKRILAEKSG